MCGCASATNMSPANRLLSCFAPAPQLLQAMSLDPLAHHAEFCLIHFERLTCKLYAAYHPPPAPPALGKLTGTLAWFMTFLPWGWIQAGSIISECDLGRSHRSVCKHIEADALVYYP